MKKIIYFLAVVCLAAILCNGVFAADFTKERTYENSFADVAEGAWYGSNVAAVYEIGLMEGVSETTFDTESEMSVAQAITIAARLHSIYNDTEIPEVEGRWFQKYVNYGVEHGILSEKQFDSYTRSILSFEMVMLFAAALPDEYFPAINDIADIHDVPPYLAFRNDILMFYNAGVLNGNDEMGTFLPMSAITRKRAAVILSRTALKDNRITFTLEPLENKLTPARVLSLMDKQTVKDTLDVIVLANYGPYSVTAAQYRYYSFVSGNDTAKTEAQLKQMLALEKIVTESDILVDRETYSALLMAYYQNRTYVYEDKTYFDALDAQNLTDAAFVKTITLNELGYLVNMDEISKVSQDDVYNFAIENDYIYATHILISNETEDAYRIALETRLKLLSGDGDFEQFVDELGEDPGLKARDGGYFFTYGTMVEPFEKAAYALAENEISGIVESDLGYHIIKRLPFDKETLASSPDYATIASGAGTKKFYGIWEENANAVTLEYIENFEGIAGILN